MGKAADTVGAAAKGGAAAVASGKKAASPSASEKVNRDRLRVVGICLSVKVLHVLFQVLVGNMFQNQDESTELLFEPGQTPLLSVTARWDSHFFISIAKEGHEYEKNHAFFELYPQILSIGTRLLQAIFGSSFNQTIIVFGLILNLALNSINSVLLFEITKLKFPKHAANFPFVVIMLYQFTPSSAFFTAIYSETLFSFFIFSYLYIFLSRYEAIAPANRGVKLFESFSGYAFTLLPTAILASSVFVRSNGMFWVAIIGFPILEAFLMNFYNAIFTRARFSFAVLFNTVAWGVFNIVISVIPFLIVLKKAENIYCAPDNVHGRIPYWCNELIPNVYNAIQLWFWDVGYLRYYKWERLFPIVWGLQTFTLISVSLLKYVLSLYRTPKATSIFQYGNLHSHMIYTISLFYISVFYAHVQSSTRFFSSDPALYWFIADILFKTKKQKSFFSSGLVILYLALFNVIGTFLFANYNFWT